MVEGMLIMQKHFFYWFLGGLDKSDGPRMGWYDISMVREGEDFEVDIK